MPELQTSWSMITAAAAGDPIAREGFHARYVPLIRSWLANRWHGRILRAEIDDAVQDVFLECFRDRGALSRAEQRRAGGFRSFLLGIVANVAARVERRMARSHLREEPPEQPLEETPAVATRMSIAMDRAWARALMNEASQLQLRRAEDDQDALLRIRLLRGRIVDGRPIRDFAEEWRVTARTLHRAYARARREYYACLREVVAGHCGEHNVDAECRRLLSLLGET